MQAEGSVGQLVTVATVHIRSLVKKDCVWVTVGFLLWKHAGSYRELSA